MTTTAIWGGDRSPLVRRRRPVRHRGPLVPGDATIYDGCDDGTEVRWRTYEGYGHIDAAEPFATYSRAERYEFYLRNPRP